MPTDGGAIFQWLALLAGLAVLLGVVFSIDKLIELLRPKNSPNPTHPHPPSGPIYDYPAFHYAHFEEVLDRLSESINIRKFRPDIVLALNPQGLVIAGQLLRRLRNKTGGTPKTLIINVNLRGATKFEVDEGYRVQTELKSIGLDRSASFSVLIVGDSHEDGNIIEAARNYIQSIYFQTQIQTLAIFETLPPDAEGYFYIRYRSLQGKIDHRAYYVRKATKLRLPWRQ